MKSGTLSRIVLWLLSRLAQSDALGEQLRHELDGIALSFKFGKKSY
jgi:hypothetical protein